MKLFSLLLVLIFLGCQSAPKNSYTFGRLHKKDHQKIKLRGGNTNGPKLDFVKSELDYPVELSKFKTKKEKDKFAILKQVGDYKVSFEFLETMGFSKDYKLDSPYFSWATEYVFPITSKENFISLQHILVMSIMKKGKLADSYVVKHWRQDWTYQKRKTFEFTGDKKWKVVNLPKKDVKGAWTQEVFQVDDSPRYASYGKWEHRGDHSVWTSALTKRPLPRREYSVRSDYDLLQGYNKVVIKSDGWFHEQLNEKVVLDKKTMKPSKILAKEVGINRYRKIENHDFSKGKEYWKATAGYWAEVRNKWGQTFKNQKEVELKTELYGKKLYKTHFEYAGKLSKGEETELSAQKHAEQTIDQFLK